VLLDWWDNEANSWVRAVRPSDSVVFAQRVDRGRPQRTARQGWELVAVNTASEMRLGRATIAPERWCYLKPRLTESPLEPTGVAGKVECG
jgi:hypothetical protein